MSEENLGFNEEEDLGKNYDSRLMKRLLKYAKPYRLFFAISIILLFATTLTDLSGPLIMKKVIDDYLYGYTKPLVATAAAPNEKSIDGKKFTQVDGILNVANPDSIYSMIYVGKKAYLVKGHLQNIPNSAGLIVNDQAGSLVYKTKDGSFPAKSLTKDEIKILRSKDISSVKLLGFMFIGIIVLGFLLNFLQISLLSYTSQTIIFNMRMEIFNHIQKLPLSFFDKNPVGRLVTRVISDTENLNDMYTNVLVNLIKDISILAGISIIMLSLNFKLALIVLAVLPIVAVAAGIFRIKIRAIYRSVRVALAKINAAMYENISGMRIIQVFGREKENFKKFEEINTSYYKAGMKEVVAFGLFRPLNDLVAALCLSVLLWFAGGDVISGSLQFGVMFAFVNYITMFFQPINDLSEKYNILQSSMASSERIFLILDTLAEEDTGNDLPKTSSIKGDIEFKNVWFAYNNEEWVLRDVSFQVPKGKTVAIVGATGAGKTSIINLINRLYEIQKGEINIDGINVKSISKKSLRQLMSVVLQDVFLFGGTIKDNIKLNNKNITDENVIGASQNVNADKFIMNFDNGYDEEVRERGATLSAGQRQLLAFARALAYNPSILILDEATANIDTETELLIQDALEKITKNRTTIVIAHRLSTIQHADMIIVLHKGKIRETGSHQELLAKKGMYFNLYNLQYKNVNNV
ncbi:ABC transporter ATP-binding protein [Pseudobacteroides cellulosolvens]|uniref:Xenobiotic-transporting ATPase n=1 Tax=Pseudobacteroides cellulosolvens ATCC 35603 = DSM 2933 TaxID=398512 RepID=A0A0L6JSP2_9FIRM|nr:ABC transporter ATP-binding protein [Pseudobacteroides cellulosolvens]KNY28704.1 Xenobiotic-transporting ATPase [Pseudobacteroides cellulosolvens ATCC 35603 = DSM 2933]